MITDLPCKCACFWCCTIKISILCNPLCLDLVLERWQSTLSEILYSSENEAWPDTSRLVFIVAEEVQKVDLAANQGGRTARLCPLASSYTPLTLISLLWYRPIPGFAQSCFT